MCEQVRVELFQLAGFVAGIFCQKALNSGHLVCFSERFNAAMCIAWMVQAVDTILSPCLVPKGASPPRSLTPVASCPNSRSPGFRLLNSNTIMGTVVYKLTNKTSAAKTDAIPGQAWVRLVFGQLGDVRPSCALFKVQEFRFQPAPSFICLSSDFINPPLVKGEK
jgi:hypothetical protein